MTSVKISFGDQIRRFNTGDVGNFKAVQEFVAKLFNNLPQAFELKYKDDESELITIASDAELNEASQFAQKLGGKVLRLYVTEVKKPEPKPAKPAVLEKPPQAAVPEKPKDLVKVDVKVEKGAALALSFEVGFKFHDLCQAISAKAGLAGSLDIKYEDDENDLVTMADDKDLQEALKLSARHLKLTAAGAQAAAQPTPTVKPEPAKPDDKKDAPKTGSPAKKPIGPSPVNKPWKEMSWEDIDKIASELNKLGFKNHGHNTELIAKYEGDWAKIIAALESGNASPGSSNIFSVE